MDPEIRERWIKDVEKRIKRTSAEKIALEKQTEAKVSKLMQLKMELKVLRSHRLGRRRVANGGGDRGRRISTIRQPQHVGCPNARANNINNNNRDHDPNPPAVREPQRDNNHNENEGNNNPPEDEDDPFDDGTDDAEWFLVNA